MTISTHRFISIYYTWISNKQFCTNDSETTHRPSQYSSLRMSCCYIWVVAVGSCKHSAVLFPRIIIAVVWSFKLQIFFFKNILCLTLNFDVNRLTQSPAVLYSLFLVYTGGVKTCLSMWATKNTTGCYYRNSINSRCKRYSLPHPLWFPHRRWVNRAMNCASVVLAALYWADSKIYNDSRRSRSRGFSLKTCCTTCIYTWAPCKVLDEPTFFIIYLHTSYYFRGKSERFEEDEVLEIIRTQGKRGGRVCTERNSMLQK